MTAVTGTAPDPNSQGTEGNGATVKTRELGRTNFIDTADVYEPHGEPEDIVGTDIGPLDVSATPPSVQLPSLRRRSADKRTAVAR
ncbi:hypothetical protein JBE27_19075 [Streptomyces albiflaviniger]|nr:hypothetical protein [Streptomyces albiflaviniger]